MFTYTRARTPKKCAGNCGQEINKGELQLVIYNPSFGRRFASSSYAHVRCAYESIEKVLNEQMEAGEK